MAGDRATPPQRMMEFVTAVQRFLDEYRRSFVEADEAALLSQFCFPLLVADEQGQSHTFETVSSWSTVLNQLLRGYRRLGVADAIILATNDRVTATGTDLEVHWEQRRADASVIYDFTVNYTLVHKADSLCVAALVHDETPKLQAALQAAS